MTDISTARVLMLATNGFEDAELFTPRESLLDAGARFTLASVDRRPISGVVWDDKAGTSSASDRTITPDLTLDEVAVDDYDALVLPGGTANPDALRIVPAAVDVVRGFFARGKLVAAICHAPWLLVEADALRGRRATGWYSVRTDMANAGAHVVDEAVVADGNLITSRMPADAHAFSHAVIDALAAARAGAA